MCMLSALVYELAYLHLYQVFGFEAAYAEVVKAGEAFPFGVQINRYCGLAILSQGEH